MHLAYHEPAPDTVHSPGRRSFLKRAGVSIAMAGIAQNAIAGTRPGSGFTGTGRMNLSTGEDWIDTFFSGGADAIIHYYADEFVFEDVTLFQTIDNKEDLYRAFVPFNDAGPDAPTGVHQFDVIRYDGGAAGEHRGYPVQPGPMATRWRSGARGAPPR